MKKIIISILTVFAFAAISQASVAYAGDVCQPTSFTADEYTLNSGEGTVLHWSSVGCWEARIDPADYPGDRDPNTSVSTGRIDDSTVFTLTVYDADGNIGGQRFLTITIRDNGNGNGGNSDCRIDDFDADDTSINQGDSTDLTWHTSGCDRVKINQGVGEVNLDGSKSVDPDQTTTYTLSAYDDTGDLADTATVRINVNEDETCSIDSFKADDSSIESGDSVRLTWKTTGADDTNLSPGGSYNADDEATVRPTRTTTYELTANCNHGSDKHKSLTISVGNVVRNERPQAITTVAAILGSTSAQLNGIAVPNTTTGTTRAWFEWGPSTNLAYKTASQTIPSNFSSNYYNAPVSGLVPGTTYFYRAAVENQNGIAYGETVPFKTQTATTTTVVKTQTVNHVVVAQSAASLLELKVDSAYDRMCVGGQIDYTVSYRNISSQTLKDAVLQITHQKEVTLIQSSRGDYDVVDRTITVDLGSIAPGETGTILVHGRVNDTAVNDNLTVMTAQVVYTNSNTRAQESAIAYSLVNISSDCPNVLGASAFGFGHFLPDTLLEWLILILIILALIVLGRQLYKKPKPPVV